jgi:nitroimidazol reductase NimA-like FMN-containing flavoprotein (pyridoxamine 5'-phosphate oxidase superfamily)
MRRKDKEVTSREWMLGVLNDGIYAEIAMAGRDGKPYVVPMNYGFDDGHLYIHGALAGKKIDILKENPYVCFNVTTEVKLVTNPDDPSDVSSEFCSVTGSGPARFLEDPDAKLAAATLLMDHCHAPMSERLVKKLKVTSVIVIDIEEMTGKLSKKPKPADSLK